MPIVARKKIIAPAAPTSRADRDALIVARVRVRRSTTPALAPANDIDPGPAAAPAPAPRPTPAPAGVTYDVGYAKPPKATRFTKGQSGNPKGRPKGAKGMTALARKLLTEKVNVKTASGVKRMTKMEAMLHKIMETAFGGNIRAIKMLLDLYHVAVPDEPVPVPGAANDAGDMDSHDHAILAALRTSMRDEET